MNTVQQADQILTYVLDELERKAPAKTSTAREIIMSIQNRYRMEAEMKLGNTITWSRKSNGNVRTGLLLLAMGVVVYIALYALWG